MTWRWLDPMADLSPTKEQRSKVAGRVWRYIWRSPVAVVVLAVWMVLAVFTPPTIGPWLRGWLGTIGLPPRWGTPGAIGVIGVFNIAIFTFLWLRLYVRPMRRALRDTGFEICVRCGYWLRDLPDDEHRCPECGARREAMAVDVSHSPGADM